MIAALLFIFFLHASQQVGTPPAVPTDPQAFIREAVLAQDKLDAAEDRGMRFEQKFEGGGKTYLRTYSCQMASGHSICGQVSEDGKPLNSKKAANEAKSIERRKKFAAAYPIKTRTVWSLPGIVLRVLTPAPIRLTTFEGKDAFAMDFEANSREVESVLMAGGVDKLKGTIYFDPATKAVFAVDGKISETLHLPHHLILTPPITMAYRQGIRPDGAWMESFSMQSDVKSHNTFEVPGRVEATLQFCK
jgi:hypothetical protein